MEWWREPIVQTLLVGVFGLLAALIGFIGGRRTMAADAKARRADALVDRIVERIELTRDFYVQLLDWYARWQNIQTPGLNRPPDRPRFADQPQANLAWLMDPALGGDVDVYIAEAARRAKAGQRIDRGMTERHLDLVDRTVRAAENQVAALQAGTGRVPTEAELSARLKAERVEELKREDPTRA